MSYSREEIEEMVERMGRPLVQGQNGLYPVHKAPVGIWDLPT